MRLSYQKLLKAIFNLPKSKRTLRVRHIGQKPLEFSMQVKKSGFVYKVAYLYHGNQSPPSRGNLCTLFWRFLFTLSCIPFVVAIQGCMTLVMLIILPLFGCCPLPSEKW